MASAALRRIAEARGGARNGDTGDNYRKTLLVNHLLTIRANALGRVGRFVQTVEAQMRSNWILMSELILFVGAVACMTGAIVLIAGV
jgi:hypothetical protein